MQTPFYVIKRVAVTKEAAMAKFNELILNDAPFRENAADLIDFCLSAPKEERVPVSLGAKVRLRASDDWHYDSPPAGTVCTVTQVVLSIGSGDNEVKFEAVADGDIQRVSFPNTTTDLSKWIEVL